MRLAVLLCTFTMGHKREGGVRQEAHLHVGAGVLPGLRVQEGGREHGRRLDLVLCQDGCQLGHMAHPHVVGGSQIGHIWDGSLQADESTV